MYTKFATVPPLITRSCPHSVNPESTHHTATKSPDRKILKKCDTLATLVDDLYTTETGGIVTYSIEDTQNTQKKKNLKKIFAGKFYWIPEATYYSSNFEVENGEFVKKGTEVISGIFSTISGVAQINEVDQELVIKPIELLSVNKLEKTFVNKSARFVKPGEFLIKDRVVVQRLAYLEFLEMPEFQYLMVRPVKTYHIPRVNSFALAQNFFPTISKKYLRIKIVTRIFYKNWDDSFSWVFD